MKRELVIKIKLKPIWNHAPDRNTIEAINTWKHKIFALLRKCPFDYEIEEKGGE